MNLFKVLDLKENNRFTDDLFLDKTFLLLGRGGALPLDTIKALKDWQFTTVYSNGNLSVSDQALLDSKKNPAPSRTNPTPTITTVTEDVSMEDMGIQDLGSVPSKFPRNESTDIETRYDFSHISDENRRLAIVQNVYNEFWAFVFDIYTDRKSVV